MKFLLLSDTHLRNFKMLNEHRAVFDKLYSYLDNNKVDYILYLGDLFHNKISISTEANQLAGEHLRKLSSYAEVHIILGNHDFLVKNKKRLDALSPIINSLKIDNIKFHKYSCKVPLENDIVLNVLSLVDKEKWDFELDESKTNIALYHGLVGGTQNDAGFVFKKGDFNIDDLERFDFAIMGDLHKHQILDSEGRAFYVGSLLQNNFGETDDKGFVVFDIKDKDRFTLNKVVIPSPKPFVTIELTKKGRLPKNINVPKEARLRLISTTNLPYDAMKRALEIAKAKFRPESIAYLNKPSQKEIDSSIQSVFNENLREIKIQEKLIEEYLKDFEVEKDVLDTVKELNSHYNTLVEKNEDVARNVNWRINRIEWDNLFNYGEDNSIEFDNLNGIVGLFGPSYLGKSGAVDCILYTIFNSTSKNERKNLNVINQNKERARGKIEIEVGNKIYTIERTSEKYEKKLKGSTTIEAKTDVDFSVRDDITGKVESLNGASRNDTDKEVRKIFGSLEDFLLTSLSSQFGHLSYIDEGSTKRKEILAKFLDLDIFDKKFKLAKEDISDIRSALKSLDGIEFDDDIQQFKKDIKEHKQQITTKRQECSLIKENDVPELETEIYSLESQINNTPTEIINIEETKRGLADNNKSLEESLSRLKKSEYQKELHEEKLEKIEKFLLEFNIEEYNKKKRSIEEKTRKVDTCSVEVRNIEGKIKDNENKEKLLKEVPCGPEYESCRFIKDAYRSSRQNKELRESLSRVEKDIESVRLFIAELNPEKVEVHIGNYDKLLDKKNFVVLEKSQCETSIQVDKNKIFEIKNTIEKLKEKVSTYNQNKKMIDNVELLLKSKGEKEEKLHRSKATLYLCEEKLTKLYKKSGSLEQKLKHSEEQKEKRDELREEYQAYDLFLRCVHSDGIAYDIIKKKLPIINDEIAKVLSNVVDFEIFFENNGRKLDIWIRHPKFDARPLEMGSGAEKVLGALVIRLALIKISNLPKPSIFVLDEPANQLDSALLDNFIGILDAIKCDFETVILISHLEALKDAADLQIEIERKDGYARISA